ncbi:MAG: DUF1840 domain-containing protein [Burkholderiaceae bacterium]|nr:DUF1840 domain-containing protein [Burkholderiaceae bacterium]
MIYKFKSQATSDLIMLGPNGDQLLRLIGREPSAKGIIEPQAMFAAIADLQQAVAAEEADRERGDAPRRPDAVSLRQRVWPMIEMMKRAQAAGEPIVWGV